MEWLALEVIVSRRQAATDLALSGTMTLEEIKQQYPNQWVLIEFTQLDDELSVVDGNVLAHSPSRDEIEKELTKVRNERIAVEFTGEGGIGEAYLIGAIAKTLNDANRSKVQ